MTTMVLPALAAASALVAGTIAGNEAYARMRRSARRRSARKSMGLGSFLAASSISLECKGLAAFVIERAAVLSLFDEGVEALPDVLGQRLFVRQKDLVEKAGLGMVLTPGGFGRSVLQNALACGAALGLLGCFFSVMLGTIGAIGGFLWGWHALARALREEVRCRAFVAERQLSQMIEVVVLGLKSGMSFDKSLALYHRSFSGSLASAVALAQSQWSHSLMDRSDALRAVARSYDSPLFDRFAENVIRSLRFGTSLSENLGLLAVEARAIRKAKLEERVAKAPVKMLLPVGTLILPAMLILIMGPILLDLMSDF